MSYPRLARHGLATLRRERARLARAALASSLMFAPAIALTVAGHGSYAFPPTLAALYTILVSVISRPLARATLLMLPLCFGLGRWLGGLPWLLLAPVLLLLLGMGRASARGCHKGVQIWLFALLVAGLSPPSALPPAQEALLMLPGGLLGFAIARTLLAGWARSPPGAELADRQRYTRHLLLWGGLALLATLPLRQQHAWWLPIMVIAIVDPLPQRMLWLARERALGTLVGGLLAMALYWLALPPLWHTLCLILLLTLTLELMLHNFRYHIAMMTALVLSLLPAAQFANGWFERMLDTLAAGLFLGLLAWRLRARERRSG